ncbi:3-hydroxyacyl-CoA dehydrogenase family protein [Streptomyces botrytidirepellens]|uniref:3-hydroxyacyl-CoA dehydrogenase family protein n=1 Tax=Streptomyces botrytidirepellens TaxID=2486417 RepID=A0A3M8VML5_9ACTN|nr:3-hydroxyacyl-CoA dehydrogenase family protein [Streptomyces botrytidirepellens]
MAIGVIGAGTMGLGVAQALAAAGHQVTAVDPVPAALNSAPDRLRAGLRAAVLLGRQEAATTGSTAERIRFTAELKDLHNASFLIECAPERISLKQDLYSALDTLCSRDTVIATCTSAIPVELLSIRVQAPERILGMHFMNPAYAKDAVEVIRGKDTGDATLARAHHLLHTMGKKGIVVHDAPGFVSNRVLMATVNDAATVVQEGTADATAVDAIFQDCFGHAMGPLRTADLIGLDIIVDTLHVLRELTDSPQFTPCALLARLVAQGKLGRKTGEGFHRYATQQA